MRFIQIIGQVVEKNRVNFRSSLFSLTSGRGLQVSSCVSRPNSCLKCWQQCMQDRYALGVQNKRAITLQTLSSYNICWQLSPIGTRGYAKGKDKKKGEKGKKNIILNESQLSEIVNVITLRDQLQKPIDKLKDEFIKNISLRSTTGSIESLPVTLEGKDYVLQELAQVVRKDPKTVVINMATFPQAIPAAIQSIKKSGLNLNPQQDGTTLFIPIPKITKEHRENLSKNAKVLFLKCRDSIKDVQNRFIKSIKHDDRVSKDDSHSAQEQITLLADQYIATAQTILDAKQTELLGNS